MGKGHKQCPQCEESVGVRTKVCECGHAFQKGVSSTMPTQKPVSFLDGPGRGRKQCSGCKQYVGVKTKQCTCGNSFEKKQIALPLPRAPLPPRPISPKPSVVASGPGKGKKQCPKCEKYVGVRTGACGCGYTFPAPGEKKQEEKKAAKILEGGGRGHKQCPQCKNYVGARSEVCACGYLFQKKESPKQTALPALSAEVAKVQAASSRAPDQRADLRIRSVIIPAGDCPVKLHNTEREEVEVWAQAIVAKGLDQNIRYEPTALRYWVRQFFPIDSQEHNEVCSVIMEMYSNPA